MTIGALQYQR